MISLFKEHLQFLTQPQKYPGMDLLRAIAVAGVVLYHGALCQYGWMTLDLFFVISGFLIGGALYDQLRVGTFSLARFYRHRAMRILPVYYFVILLGVVVKPFVLQTLPPFQLYLSSVLSSLVLMQTTGAYYFGWPVYRPVIPGGSWSLCVEELFYLLFPCALLAVYRWCKGRPRTIFIVLGLLALSGIAMRALTTYAVPDCANWNWANLVQFHSRYDELLTGVLAALVVRHCALQPLTKGLCVLWGLLILTVFMCSGSATPEVACFSRACIWVPVVLCASFALLSVGIAEIRWHWWPVTACARLCLPVYLLHCFASEVTHKGFKFTSNGIGIVVATIVAAYLVSLCIEFPFIRMYKREKEPVPGAQNGDACWSAATRKVMQGVKTLAAEHLKFLTAPQKYPGLDLIRAAGVAAVVCGHANIFPIGWIAMDFFFIQSGCLIGGLLYDQLRAGTFSLTTFYRQRLLRILPVYYFVVLLGLAVKPFVLKTLPPLSTYVTTVLSQFIAMQTTGAYYFHWPVYDPLVPAGSWSLCVEELFYLIFPCLLFVIYRVCKGSPIPMCLVFGTIALSAIWARYAVLARLPGNDINIIWASFIQIHARYDELLAGVVIALIMRRFHLSMWGKVACTLWGALILSFLLSSSVAAPEIACFTRANVWIPVVAYVGFGLFCLGMATFRWGCAPITAFARMCLPVYLIHCFVAEIASGKFGFTPGGIGYVIVALVLSYLVSLFIEYPCIRLYKRAKTAPATSEIAQPVPALVT